MPTWPATLPQLLLKQGYDEQRASAVVRSSNDTGPAKVRRRYTAAATNINGTIRVSAAQKAALDSFFITDLMEGSLSFDWVDPISQAAASFRFLSPPHITPAGGVTFNAALQLEILP